MNEDTWYSCTLRAQERLVSKCDRNHVSLTLHLLFPNSKLNSKIFYDATSVFSVMPHTHIDWKCVACSQQHIKGEDFQKESPSHFKTFSDWLPTLFTWQIEWFQDEQKHKLVRHIEICDFNRVFKKTATWSRTTPIWARSHENFHGFIRERHGVPTLPKLIVCFCHVRTPTFYIRQQQYLRLTHAYKSPWSSWDETECACIIVTLLHWWKKHGVETSTSQREGWKHHSCRDTVRPILSKS